MQLFAFRLSLQSCLPTLRPTSPMYSSPLNSSALGKTCWFAVALVLIAVQSAEATRPLHERVDAAIGCGDPEFERLAAADAGDAAFIRRVYLDLAGTIPSSDQVRRFLAESAADKRAQLVDQLLESPRYARHMQYVFDTMLMERRPAKYVKADQWQAYLRQSFAENKPWDQFVTEMLTADGADETNRAAARFLLDRELKPDPVTRDLGRIFLGRDLQCAQCHDHPNVDDYLQRHYHGLAAFLNRSYLFTDPKTKQASIGEKAEGVVKFTSVFTSEAAETAPRMLDLPPVEDPPMADEPYKVKPEKKKVRSVPVYSRRLQLASAMTDPSNAAFRRNIVNRLWAMMMGRGIVEPVDMWHAGNPPSHPELLEMLADDFAAHHYDVKYLLRELARTKTYQRSSQYPPGAEIAPDDRFAVALQKPLSPEQLAWSMMQATSLTEATLQDLQAKHRKAHPDDDPQTVEDPVWQEAALHDALKGHVASFVDLFGVTGIQTSQFDASANQALFLRNGKVLQSWLTPQGARLTAKLKALDAPQLVDEFYMAVFSRPPGADEQQQISEFLARAPEGRDAALGQLVWAALSSAEFRFNH